MGPTLPPKHLPARDRRPAKRAEQSQQMLAVERARTAQKDARQDLRSRRARQQAKLVDPGRPSSDPATHPTPAGRNLKGKQTARQAAASARPLRVSQHSQASEPSTTNATVNASIGASPLVEVNPDPILQELLEDEVARNRHLTWFADHHPTYAVATLDLEELEQLRKELGPGPTLRPNHDLHPNVQVKPRPRSSQHDIRATQHSRHSHPTAEELGVNSSFEPRQHQHTRASTDAHPIAKYIPQSQPLPPSRRLDIDAGRRMVPNQPQSQPAPTLANYPGAVTVAPRSGMTMQGALTGKASSRRNSKQGPAVPRSSSDRPTLSHARVRLAHASIPVQAPSSPPQPVPRVQGTPTAEDLGLNINQADFERILETIDDRVWRGRQGKKPIRSEWSGLILQLVDRTADDAKASPLAAGFMKGAEDRELIICQAWDRACEWYSLRHPFPKIKPRQILYIQNLFPSFRKLMKTRINELAVSDYHLRDGTPTGIQARVAELLPHAFHTHAPEPGEDDIPLPFEHVFLGEALTTMAFRSPQDLGVQFNTLFNPIPPRLLSFTCAMTADIVSEYGTGTHVPKSTYIESLRHLFNTYIASLENFRFVNKGRYDNLLIRLHDYCMTKCGAMHGQALNNPENVIPVEAFDARPVERYELKFSTEQIQAMLTRRRITDSTEELGSTHGGSVDEDHCSFGEPGPGPATTRNREAAHRKMVGFPDHAESVSEFEEDRWETDDCDDNMDNEDASIEDGHD